MAGDDRTLTYAGTGQALRRAGKYRIVGRIGEGGMGVVYRAVDDDLGRVVALKFIPEHLASNTTAEQRFLREARAASALDHVNIGAIFGVEETEDHRRFIVMAYYEGQNLSERMKDESRPFTVAEALDIAKQIACGLAEAHEHGVIHRDIKPSNILIKQGLVKIVDFGLASMADAEQLTETQARMGTPAYMSPEQALGEPADARSDVWSLGVVLYEMVTHRRAFQGESIPALLYQVVHGELPPLEDVDPSVRVVLERALQKKVEGRFQNMREFLEALEALEPHSAGSRRPAVSAATTASQTVPLTRGGLSSRRKWIAAVAIIGVLAGAGTIWRIRTGSGGGKAEVQSSATGATAYESYLEGLALVKRWDKADNLERAIALFTDATTRDSRFALGFARLADAQRIRYALTRDKTWLDAATRNAHTAANLNPNLSPVQVSLGRVHAALGSNDLALAALEAAIRIDANDAEANTAIARQYEKLGRLKEAEERYQRASVLEPDNIATRDAYGNFLFRQNRYQDAAVQWQAVIRSAPDHAPAYVNLGSAMSEMGNIAESIGMYEKSVALNPSYMAYSNLGTAYARAERYPEAVEAYRRALSMDGSDSMVWGNLASVYSWMPGRQKEALENYGQAIRLAEAASKDSPRNAYLHGDLAIYYAKTGKAELAAQRLSTALALAPDSAAMHLTAAEVYEILGKRDQGVEHARRAVRMGLSPQRLHRNREIAGLLKDPRMTASR
jgi:eukaryotic-like serine/threonine-protein kinase